VPEPRHHLTAVEYLGEGRRDRRAGDPATESLWIAFAEDPLARGDVRIDVAGGEDYE
jgi:hypothetical protein